MLYFFFKRRRGHRNCSGDGSSELCFSVRRQQRAGRACERGRASRSRRRGEPVSTEPVAIIAAGGVTPIGADLDAVWTRLVTGVDGGSRIERFPLGDLRVGLGGEIKKVKRERRGDRPAA